MTKLSKLAFDQPPIWEVGLSVMTEPGLMSDYDVSGFHDLFRSEFPAFQANMGIESLAPAARVHGPQPQFSYFGNDMPPRRWWFIAPDNKRLVQAQENMLALNWRRLDMPPVGPSNYPGFDAMLEEYQAMVGVVSDRLVGLGAKLPNPVNCELLYVNLISMRDAGGNQLRLEDVLVGHQNTSQGQPRFSWQNSWFEEVSGAPDPKQTSLQIDLSAAAFANQSQGEQWPVVRMQLVSRSTVKTWDDVFAFFLTAHELASDRLISLTTERIRENWDPK